MRQSHKTGSNTLLLAAASAVSSPPPQCGGLGTPLQSPADGKLPRRETNHRKTPKVTSNQLIIKRMKLSTHTLRPPDHGTTEEAGVISCKSNTDALAQRVTGS